MPTSQPSTLDALLASYLAELDSYSALRASLSKTLSAGFLSLAQSQRSSALPAGQRYGSEMYDSRMKAECRIRCDRREGGTVYSAAAGGKEGASVTNAAPVTEEEAYISKADTAAGDADAKSSIQEGANTSSFDSKTERSDGPEPALPSKRPLNTSKPRDPISQFAIFPPQALLSSQKSFKSAVSLLPDLINTSRSMEALERRIQEVRAALDLESDAMEDVVGAEDRESDSKTEETTEGRNEKELAPSPSKQRSLASRSKVVEPRPRVLKLGS